MAWATVTSCTPADPPLPLDRPTVEGQRLWYLAQPSPGLAVADQDRLVAQPLSAILIRDDRVELSGSLSREDVTVMFIRTPVTLSSLVVVQDALGLAKLPDGSGQALFGAAGPPGQADRSLQTPSPESLLAGGLGATDLLSRLAAMPVWLEPLEADRRPRFDHAVRIRAPDMALLAERFSRCEQEAGVLAAGRLPGVDRILRLDAGTLAAYLVLAGSDAAERCRRMAENTAHRSCRSLSTMPDGERALLGWPRPTDSTLERAPGGG